MKGSFGLDDLRLIAAIGETLSLSGGARSLGVDHSTAFRRLEALERRIGVRLFVRARAGYTPTTAGEAAIAAARDVLEEISQLEHRLAGADLRPSGQIRVTTADTLLGFLAPAFAEFRAAYPDIVLEVQTSNALFTLTKRDADVAIRPTAIPPEHLTGRRIAGVATALYASTAYLARYPEPFKPADHAWLAPDETLAHLSSARWIERHVPPERIALRANSLLTLQAAARANMGVAPLPCYLGDADPLLRRAGQPNEQMASALWLLTHPDLKNMTRIRAFLDFMAAWLSARREQLEGAGTHSCPLP